MCDKCAKRINPVKEAAEAIGHVPEYKSGVGFIDSYVCSCGWKSLEFWDGAEYAFDQWLEHAKQVIKSGQMQLAFLQPS